MKTVLVFISVLLFAFCKPQPKKDFESYTNTLEKNKVPENYRFYKIGPLRANWYSITYPDSSYYSFVIKDSLIENSFDKEITKEKLEDLKMKLKQLSNMDIELIESDSSLMQIRTSVSNFDIPDDSVKDKQSVILVFYNQNYFNSSKSQRHFKTYSPKKIRKLVFLFEII